MILLRFLWLASIYCLGYLVVYMVDKWTGPFTINYFGGFFFGSIAALIWFAPTPQQKQILQQTTIHVEQNITTGKV